MTRDELAALFDQALKLTRERGDDSDDDVIELSSRLLHECEVLGYDWEKDDALVRYCLKATGEECLIATKAAAFAYLFADDGCPECHRNIDRLGGNPDCPICAAEPPKS